MADTDTELPNGIGALSEEDERLKQRPADIDADVREMERRKRVEALMSSKLFREELERVLDQQLHEGSDAPLLQRIREMVGGRLHTGSLRGPSCVLPINDIRGIEGVGYEKGEKILRCKLAAVYRLVDLFGWTQTGITGQITARLNTAVEQVLTTPRGLLPHEVTASSLVKVDMQGTVQDQGTTNFPVNVEGFSLHATVHASRPDVRCVLHVRSPSALAVSSMKRGLLPLCHEAALLGDIAYHHVPYGTLDNEERDKLVRALGPHAKVLMLASGGALCCGATLEEAFFQARHLTAACDVQLRISSLPVDELQLIDDETRKQMYEAAHRPPAESGSKWRVGGEEFEALMRMLDNAGFRTGYIYRHPLIKNDVPKPKNDVEVPPAVSSLGYLLEEEELYRQGLWKKGTGTRGERTRWLNSPNVYQKVEMLETGTTDPKKITKWVDANNDEWVQDGSPAHSSTPVKIDTLQFVPMKTNPKEFKKLQQQIKENRRADKISAGPQSHILEGVTWDEANKLVSEDAHNTHTGDHVVLMGAASKGIIQRGYQHNATVYSAPYARNPFDHVTDREIDEYRRVVERKQRSDYDTDLSESEAISAAQITSPASATETEEESRDEHRVLRIETKQVPVRSQPEVVLSDDFLNAERAHADRNKDRDPNLLSDDEVFLDSASSVTSPMTSPLPARAPVVVHQRVVQRSVVRGTEKRNTATNTLHEAMSSNKRSIHDYPRVNGLENIIKKFDSPEQSEREDFKRPKCKINLNSQLESVKCDSLDIYNRGYASSRSSLYSIPSLDWDGRCKSEYVFKTQSLPRQKSKPIANKLHRTQSHSGFVNAHLKDPEPFHYHLPRCRSCGAFNSSYAWELSKREERVEKRKRTPFSMYFSADDLPRKCLEEREVNVVKVAEKVVPVFKVEKGNEEFVESQEFNEDNYIEEINSFSSDNLTVVENDNGNDEQNKTVTEETVKADGMGNADFKSHNNFTISSKDALKKAEFIPIIHLSNDEAKINAIDVVEGEYHSFTVDEYFDDSMYESPVKDLVEKDIRDYSVPIDFYYDGTKGSPEKKRRELVDVVKANLLEPILEESKSSYGDDSRNSSGNHGKTGSDDLEFTKINRASEIIVEEMNQMELQSENIKRDFEDKAIKELFVKADNRKKRLEDIKKVTEENKAVKESSETEDVKSHNSKLQAEDIQKETNEDEAIKELLEVINLKEDNSNTLTLERGALKEKVIHYEIELQQKKELQKSVETNTQSGLDLEPGTETTDNQSTVVQNIVEEILIKTCTAVQLKFEINYPDSKKVTTEVLESDCRSKQESYVLVDEDTDFINNGIESIATNLEQTAVDIYSEGEVEDTDVEQDQLIESVFDDVFKILSTDAVNCDIVKPLTAEIKDERQSLYSLASSVPEQPSVDTTAEFEKYEIIAGVVSKILDKIDLYNSNKDFFNIQRKVLPENLFDVDANVSKVEIANENEMVENEIASNIYFHNSESTCMDFKDKDVNSESCINFSITTMIKELENNLNLNETVLTEHSDTEYSLAHKIVESVLYYILDRAFFLYSNKSNCKRMKRSKKVITIVEKEDILYTAVPLWLEKDRAPKDFSIENKIPLEKEITFDNIETCLNNHSNAEESKLPKHDSTLKSLESDFDGVHFDNETVKTDDRVSHVIHDSYQPAQAGNVHVTNIPLDLLNCKSEQFEGDLIVKGNYKQNNFNDSHCEIDQDLEFEINEVPLKSVDLEINENSYTEFCFGHHVVEDETIFEENLTCDNLGDDNSRAHEVLKSNTLENMNFESLSTSYEMAADIVCEMLERSTFAVGNSREINDTKMKAKREAKIENDFTKTFILGQGDMNTAFVISESINDYYSRSSSPHKEAIFDACTESPIKNPNDTFIGDDLSVLYKKDDTILGSPFIKKVPVLSMSQTVHSGGIKYWVSFDESLTMDSDNERQVSKSKPKKNLENKIPSFLVVDLSETENERETTDDYWGVFEKGMYRRSSILMEDYDNNSEELTIADGTYVTASVSDYKTCESDFIDTVNEDEPQKRLVYDSRVDLQRRTKRQYSSWPPFDDTLFYRIISKFRMSESFDPSDLENVTVNSSTSF